MPEDKHHRVELIIETNFYEQDLSEGDIDLRTFRELGLTVREA